MELLGSSLLVRLTVGEEAEYLPCSKPTAGRLLGGTGSGLILLSVVCRSSVGSGSAGAVTRVGVTGPFRKTGFNDRTGYLMCS